MLRLGEPDDMVAGIIAQPPGGLESELFLALRARTDHVIPAFA